MEGQRIIIRSVGAATPFGGSFEQIQEGFQSKKHYFTKRKFNSSEEWIAPLALAEEQTLNALRSERNLYRELDRTALIALIASRRAYQHSGWDNQQNIGVVIGSSRGATETFEKQHRAFLESVDGRIDAVTSPITTLGNISSTVAQDLLLHGPEISHSVTCSTAHHSILNAISWIKSGLCRRFLVGGVEAPLTPFTIAQMKALRIYTDSIESEFPCQPLRVDAKRNSFVLGEGGAVFAIEALEGYTKSINPPLALIDGIGWSIEPIQTLTSVSAEGEAFYRSMSNALSSQQDKQPIDLVIAHAPGTLAGDRAELTAINDLFEGEAPPIVSPKWQIGHSFGASGALSILYAIHLLNGGKFEAPSYMPYIRLDEVRSVMVNAAGFGGNTSSIIIKKGTYNV